MGRSLTPGIPKAISSPLIYLAVAYLALSTLYNVVTPPFEASDEFHHYPFVKWLADGKGLPVMGPDAGQNLYRQEGAQPPLYYLLAAAISFWIDTGDQRQLYRNNPHTTAGEPHAPDNKNLVLHNTEEEGFPYSGRFMALHQVRLLSTMLGLVTLIGAYLLALKASREDKLVAAGAAALVAFNPMFLFVSSSVNNDNLVNALAAVTLFVLTGMLLGKHSVLRYCLLGLLVGAAALSKLSGLALLPLSLLVLAISFARKRTWRPLARAATIVISLTAAVAGWWYLRNWLLYGDPLGLNVFLSTAGGRHAGIAELLGELEGLKLSFWGVFGGFNIVMDKPLYWFYDGLSLAAAFGLVAVVLSTARGHGRSQPLLVAMHFLWIGGVALALARWTSMTLASQGRLLFPAIPSIAIFLSLGIFSFGPYKLRRLGVASLSLLLAAIAALVPFLYISPAYPSPALVSEERAHQFTHPLFINFADRVELLGYDLAPTEAGSGGEIAITLYWHILNKIAKDYSLFIHLFGRDNLPIGQRDTFLAGGAYPTSGARAGAYLVDTYRVRVYSGISRPTAARIEVGFYDLSGTDRLEARDRQGRPLGTSPGIARFKVRVPPSINATGLERITPMDAGKGEEMELVGYRVDGARVTAGGEIQGRLGWRALQRPRTDYSIFVQVVGPAGLAGQYDSQPQSGDYPTSFWDPGEEVEEVFRLKLPQGTPAGRYELIAGMYDLATGTRVALGGRDHVRLMVITVEE